MVFKQKAKVLEGASLKKKPARERADAQINPDALMQDWVWGVSKSQQKWRVLWGKKGEITGPGMVYQVKELEFNLIYNRKPFKDFKEVLNNHSEGNVKNK